jgi:hypothetical protein
VRMSTHASSDALESIGAASTTAPDASHESFAAKNSE